jgi:hypothetical protein
MRAVATDAPKSEQALTARVNLQEDPDVRRVAVQHRRPESRAHGWAYHDVIGTGAAVITSEYDRWQTATGTAVLDRLDILAVDTDGPPGGRGAQAGPSTALSSHASRQLRGHGQPAHR